jgi:hypoxanthine phosphoribosyltransferase
MTMDDDILEVLVDEASLARRTAELAEQLTKEYQDKLPVVVCILKGGVNFFTDLTRKMRIYMQLDFMAASSYGNARESSGEVRIRLDLSFNITDRHVLIVEDIVDTGRTMTTITELLRDRKPASIKTCVMLNKESRRILEFHPDYVGFEIEDKFVVGAGLEYYGKYRNLPYVGVLKPEVYETQREPE